MNILLFKPGEVHLDASDSRAKHIKNILHLKKGDSFKAGIINSRQGTASIVNDQNGIDLEFSLTEDRSSLYPLSLIIAQIRPICMRRILRECASMGVSRLILPVSELGEKSYLDSSFYKDEEYKSVIIDGAMQSGCSGVSECILARNVSQAISLSSEDEKILLDNVIGGKSLSDFNLSGRSVVLAIGPERGWTEHERTLFTDNGFKPALMGKRILRTETASVAATTLALSKMGLI